MTTLSTAGKAKLDALLADQVKNSGLPGLFYGLTTAEGEIYFNCAGKKNEGDASEGDINDKTTLQLWSMTKMITSLACLQLVGKGDLALDDPAVIEKYLPEVWAQPILTGFDGDTPITTPRTKPLTLRHLLTHTSGLAYSLLSPLLAQWDMVSGTQSWASNNAKEDTLFQPLLFEPGTKYQYGTSIDVAGLLVMRVTGKTLDEYFHENIFGPSGVAKDDISFYPTDSIRERLMQSCVLLPDGRVIASPGTRDIKSMTPDDIGIHLGGAGLFGTAKAYMAVLRQILLGKEGKSTVVSKETFDYLFTPSLPARDTGTTCHSDLGTMVAIEGETEKQFISGDKINHTLGMAYYEADSENGPKDGSAFWGGVARTRYWVDPTTGIAGWYGTQLFDRGQPAKFAKPFSVFQRAVYDALEL